MEVYIVSETSEFYSTVYKDAGGCRRDFKVGFQILMEASMKMTAFWDIATCSLVEVE
jgi:hypothetical protein